MTFWFGENVLPKTYYIHLDTGWTDCVAFARRFEIFGETVKDRPLLLIFDNHLSQITIAVIMRALEENITILKFSPCCTDLLQLLDRTCFGPLKRKWETELGERMIALGSQSVLNKGEFANLLCSIWNKGIPDSNIKSDYSTTGIWPLGEKKYPAKRIDLRLLQKCK